MVTLLSLIWPGFLLRPSRCNATLPLPSVRPPILSPLTSYYLSSLSCFIAMLFILTSPSPVLCSPYFFVYFSVHLALVLPILLSAARMSLLWPSCQLPSPPVHTHAHTHALTHTHTHRHRTHLHICVHAHDSMEESLLTPNIKEDGRQGTIGER